MLSRRSAFVLVMCLAGCSVRRDPGPRIEPPDGAHYAPPGFVQCPSGYTVAHRVSICQTEWACVSGGRLKCIAIDGAIVDPPLIDLVR